MQIARTGKLRAKTAPASSLKRELVEHRLPLVLIALAMLGYLVVVWQWL